ncbi:MAG TPA: RluA family pseudouridine synthase [Vicinamibacterales bacterium]|nr:RluA family pseudouridine synthase [Vicinamibacterales bacterium]
MSGSRWRVTDAEAGLRLDKFLAAAGRLASRGRASGAIERGKVFINDTEVPPDGAATRLRAGDDVRVWMDRPGSSKPRLRAGTFGALRVVYEDDALLVVNKPAGLLAVPLARQGDAPSIYDLVEDHFRSRGKRRPFVVHRIDRDTSGLVVFAKNARAQALLKEQFKRREPERVYWAVVYGHPAPPSGTWRDRLVWDRVALIQKETHPRDRRGSEAISEYRVLETFENASLIEVRLRTGRRNQIRLQARLRGHTLVGEKRYTVEPESLRPIPFARQALHALRLKFRHPVEDRTMEFEAPPPADFAQLLRRLRVNAADRAARPARAADRPASPGNRRRESRR